MPHGSRGTCAKRSRPARAVRWRRTRRQSPGKTGTAEVTGAKSHSWFVGFAPFGGSRRIAFAVLIENAGYGGRTAAPIAGEIVTAARELGLFR